MKKEKLSSKLVQRKDGLIETPWGEADRPVESYADGKLLWFDTSCHGGFWVHPDLNKLIPEDVRADDGTGCGWYEEDADWTIVVQYLPQYVPNDMKKFVDKNFGT